MNEINLVPSDVLLAYACRARLKVWGAAMGVALLAAVVPILVRWERAGEAARLQSQWDQLEADLSADRARLRATTAEAVRLHLELERARALRAKRSWSGMLALISSCLPADCWLASMATDPEAPGTGSSALPADKADPGRGSKVITIEAPRKLRMIGYSNSDAPPLVFVSRLQDSNVFSHVALERALQTSPAKTGDGSLYQFEVVCRW